MKVKRIGAFLAFHPSWWCNKPLGSTRNPPRDGQYGSIYLLINILGKSRFATHGKRGVEISWIMWWNTCNQGAKRLMFQKALPHKSGSLGQVLRCGSCHGMHMLCFWQPPIPSAFYTSVLMEWATVVPSYFRHGAEHSDSPYLPGSQPFRLFWPEKSGEKPKVLLSSQIPAAEGSRAVAHVVLAALLQPGATGLKRRPGIVTSGETGEDVLVAWMMVRWWRKNSATVRSNGLSKLPPTWNMPRFLTSQSSCSPWNAAKPNIYIYIILYYIILFYIILYYII